MSDLLTFEHAFFDAEDYDCGAQDIHFSLAAGESIIIAAPGERQGFRVPLMDAAQGLVRPAKGRVSCNGEDWAGMSADQQASCRGAMGRVFHGQAAWISNLDVDENVTLRVRHHTGRKPSDILEEAQAIARELGLDGLPPGRPSVVDGATLQVCQWVRALLGSPSLLLADHPGGQMDDAARGRIKEAIARRCRDGLSVLWFTVKPQAWREYFPSARYYHFSGERLTEQSAP